MVRLRLPDADRERYGCPEWLEADIVSVTVWEAALIQRGFTRDGIRVAFDTPGAWRKALMGEVVTDENDAPRRRPDFGAEIMLVWLELRRAGVDVSMAEVEFGYDGLRWDLAPELDPEPDDEPVPGESEGKDDAGEPAEQPQFQTSPA